MSGGPFHLGETRMPAPSITEHLAVYLRDRYGAMIADEVNWRATTLWREIAVDILQFLERHDRADVR